MTQSNILSTKKHWEVYFSTLKSPAPYASWSQKKQTSTVFCLCCVYVFEKQKMDCWLIYCEGIVFKLKYWSCYNCPQRNVLVSSLGAVCDAKTSQMHDTRQEKISEDRALRLLLYCALPSATCLQCRHSINWWIYRIVLSGHPRSGQSLNPFQKSISGRCTMPNGFVWDLFQIRQLNFIFYCSLLGRCFASVVCSTKIGNIKLTFLFLRIRLSGMWATIQHNPLTSLTSSECIKCFKGFCNSWYKRQSALICIEMDILCANKALWVTFRWTYCISQWSLKNAVKAQ